MGPTPHIEPCAMEMEISMEETRRRRVEVEYYIIYYIYIVFYKYFSFISI